MSDHGPYSRGRSLAANFPYLHGGSVEFGEAIRQGFRNGFVYRGRASRPAYWWFVLFLVIFDFALEFIFILINALGGGGSGASVGTVAASILVIITSFFTIYLELVLLALLVRRLHDIDKSGWWVLIGFVPFAGAIILLIFTLRKGTPELNRYQP